MLDETLLLLRLRWQTWRNGVRFAPRVHQLIGALLLLGGAALFVVVYVAFGALLQTTAQNPVLQTELIGRTVFYLFLFLLAGGIPFVSGVLLTPGDLPLLGATPLRPRALVAARLLDAVVVSSAQFVVIGVPLLVAIAQFARPGALGWLVFAPLLLLFLALPALLVAALLLALARLLGVRRVRVAVALASAVLSVAMCLLTVSEFGQRANHGGFSPAALSIASRPLPPWLPSTGMANALQFLAHPKQTLVPLAELTILTGGVFGLCLLLGGPVLVGESLLEGDNGQITRRRSLLDATLAVLPLSQPVRALLAKDARYILRDLVLLSQIGVPVILYFVPFIIAGQMDKSANTSGDLLLLSVGIVGTIAYMETSILGLSSVGLEGRGFWLVLESSVSAGGIIWAKWLGACFGSLLLTVPLFLASCLFFHATPTFTLLGLGLLTICCMALCGFSVGLSGLFPRFVYDNPAHRASLAALVWGFVGATLYVLLGSAFIGGGVWAASAWSERATWFLGSGIGLFVLLSVLTGLLPLLAARARLRGYSWEG